MWILKKINSLIETFQKQKQMLKLMSKKIFTFLPWKFC